MTHSHTIRRHATPTKRKASRALGVVVDALHPANRTGRTLFPSRVFAPDEVQRVFKDGHQSRKIGKIVAKGKRRGWPIYTLTLEERRTCPRSCAAWSFCYGNNMQAAERLEPGPALEQAVWDELRGLQSAHPGGFLVRLHILGDFYSVDYVKLWHRALKAFPALHVFGFTARSIDTQIGAALHAMVLVDFERFAMRWSGRDAPELGAQLLPGANPAAIPCPAQTGATECCATCALCWTSRKTIAFERH